ncbi:CapA family protein [Streptomyces sp. WMMB303]|uniref:CapA family protein n=1 Tax=Streptomyces sp. WMMB303 TaxID=3034154 RepID=UPI0023EC6267|nr:CapA family protein [Streptomyces sp. WMMB303]MDF4252488.1 CapA family protein [Streptomyces sp. WMMB303]
MPAAHPAPDRAPRHARHPRLRAVTRRLRPRTAPRRPWPRGARHRTTAALALAALLGGAAGCGQTGGGTGRDGGAAGHGSGEQAEQARGGQAARGFSLFATGDLLVHDSLIRQARADADGSGYDFGRMLAAAKPLADRADLAICHMETIYGPDGGPFTGYPLFQTPPQLARSVKDAGYDSCSTGSNHTLDDSADGVNRTLEAMDSVGLRHAGSARSAGERRRPTMLRAGGAKVAQLSYTYGTNGISLPENKPWLVNLIDPERIIRDARAARRAGADVVVASMHWGTEWQQEPDELQRSLAKKLTAARSGGRRDIDLILGTHAHVPQAYEKVNGTWVVYGMGDQIAGKMNDPRGSMGTAARFRFVPPEDDRGAAAWTVEKAQFTPFMMKTSPRHTLVNLASKASRSAGDPAQDEAYASIREAVFSRGAEKDGLRMVP